MTDMTLNTDEMYAEWEKQAEGLCPKCGIGDTAMAQEVSHCWHRWDPRPEAATTDGEEMLLISTKCSDCDWTGYMMYQLGPFAGCITDEQIEVMEEAMMAKDEARNEAIRKGEICWLHEKPDCSDPNCQPVVPEPQPVNKGEAFSIVNRALTSIVDEEE